MSDLSLISYFEPSGGNFFLNVVFPCSPADCGNGPRYPFQVLNNGAPFSRLLRAELVSGEGGAVSPLFLLVQRDDYLARSDTLWPLDNPALARHWQETFSCISGEHLPHSRIFPLKDATTPEGRLIPFRPLFFCTSQKRFFHPICSTCGRPIELCKDDALLSSKKIETFVASLRRFLYCPTCSRDDFRVFAYAREAADPEFVKDRGDLVRSWRNIVSDCIDSEDFPCTACSDQTSCHGEAGLFEDRIIPFNFYPAHMIAFDAMSISAVDFLPMISGAAIEDVLSDLEEKCEWGRRDCLLAWRRRRSDGEFFLFSGHEKHFLEILYLKLSFLGDIARTFLSSSGAPAPHDIFSALNAIWVKLPDRNSLLPAFWNFETGLFMVGSCDTETTGLPKSSPASVHYYLGIVWFFSLLANKYRSAHAVRKALSPVFDSTPEQPFSIDAPDFDPGNIFWDPATLPEQDIPDQYLELWTRSLHLGLDLLKNRSPEEEEFREDFFFQQLDEIRSKIKTVLFSETTVPAIGNEDTAHDGEIYRILSGISGRMKQASPEQDVPEEEEEETFTQTVILSRSTLEGPMEDRQVKTAATEPSDNPEDEIKETVILKPQSPPAATSPPEMESTSAETPESVETGKLKPAMPEDDDVMETVILKPDAAPTAAFPPGAESTPPGMPDAVETEKPKPARPEDDDVMETVILKPGAAPTAAFPPGAESTPPGIPDAVETEKPKPARPEDDDVMETVILKPKSTPPPAPPSSHGPARGMPDEGREEDDLMETLILPPNRNKDRNK